MRAISISKFPKEEFDCSDNSTVAEFLKAPGEMALLPADETCTNVVDLSAW